MKKTIPNFSSEAEERDFWATHDSTEYFDIHDTTHLDLSNLKPSSKSITLRMPETMVREIKIIANSQDVPYQSLMKTFLSDKIKEYRLKQ